MATIGGQLCIDKNGAIFLRNGRKIVRVTAMCVHNGMLVFGVGEESDYPNLLYLDKTTPYEKGKIVSGVSDNNYFESIWESAVYSTKDVRLSKCMRIEFMYVADADYGTATDAIHVQYRNADGSERWQDLITATPAQDDNTYFVAEDVDDSDKEAVLWQFQIYVPQLRFRVLKFTPYLRSEPLTQDN